MKFKFALFLLVIFAAFSPLSMAAEALSQDKTPPTGFQTYLMNVDKKFDRGALNFVAGWTEFIRQPIAQYKSHDKKRWLHAAGGAGLGVVEGVVDIVGGFFNSLTSIFPQFEIPLPQDGIKAENVTGGNAEVFPNEEVVEPYSNTSPQSSSPNL